MPRGGLHLRRISPDNSFSVNIRIAKAFMKYIDAQAIARGGENSQEELDLLHSTIADLTAIRDNMDANHALVESAFASSMQRNQ